jgi:hypothetical protein
VFARVAAVCRYQPGAAVANGIAAMRWLGPRLFSMERPGWPSKGLAGEQRPSQ